MLLSCQGQIYRGLLHPGLFSALAHIRRGCASYRQPTWSSSYDGTCINSMCLAYSPPSVVPDSHVHSGRQQNLELLRYRTQFPDSMWQHIACLLQSRPFPTAVDMGFAALGAQGPELQQLGFQVAEAVPPSPGETPAAHPRLPSGCSDLVTCLPGPTTPHSPELLTEAHRLLCKGGFLAVAWNDRDLSSPFVLELESLLESLNPDYCRSSKQHNPPAWTNALTDGRALKLVSFTCHPHSLPMARCAALQDLLGGLACVRAHLAASSATRKMFHMEVRTLVERHFNPDQSFNLPLVTKLYVLRKQAAAATVMHKGHLVSSAAECQQSACMSTTSVSECGVSVLAGSDDEQEEAMQPVIRTSRHGCSLHF